MDGQASEFFPTSTAKIASKRAAVQQGFVNFTHVPFLLTPLSRRNPAADFYAMNKGSTKSALNMPVEDCKVVAMHAARLCRGFCTSTEIVCALVPQVPEGLNVSSTVLVQRLPLQCALSTEGTCQAACVQVSAQVAQTNRDGSPNS